MFDTQAMATAIKGCGNPHTAEESANEVIEDHDEGAAAADG